MNLDDKYIDLLINRCMKMPNKSLFLCYNKEISPFINKLKEKVKELGVTDIYEEIEDTYYLHDLLSSLTVEEIKTHPYFNKSIWDEYAKKDSNFLMVETEMPGIMDDIDSEKLAMKSFVSQTTKPLYRKLQNQCKLSWCICAYPGKLWAESVYPNDDKAYEKLYNDIMKMCMVDTDNPSDKWNNFLERNKKIANYLNDLNIEKLQYTNSLGTDLTLYLPNNYIYESALDSNVLVNMPSYEIFTSPIYSKTEGIVYSAKPLMYQGSLVKDFYIKFNEGKVIGYDAKVGKDILKEIIETDNNSSYLGECALVEVNSPISMMNTIYGTTLIDENASCHLALGEGFAECIKEGLKMSDEELLGHGINRSKTHVDFMIGTTDLNIVATLKNNEEITIFENGNFSKEILENI